MDLVQRFAEALDADDYDTASACLEEYATYDAPESVITGREAILQSFRATSEWGRSNLDGLRFLHSIDESEPLAKRFVDILTHGGEELVVHHTMHVTLSKTGMIAALRLVSPDGENERVGAFFRRHGLQRAPLRQE